MRLASAPCGSPPAPWRRQFQKKLWFQCCAAVVEDLLRLGVADGARDHLLQRHVREARARHELVQLLHVGRVVLAVVQGHGARRNHRREGAFRERKRRKLERSGLFHRLFPPKLEPSEPRNRKLPDSMPSMRRTTVRFCRWLPTLLSEKFALQSPFRRQMESRAQRIMHSCDGAAFPAPVGNRLSTSDAMNWIGQTAAASAAIQRVQRMEHA
jgi:hypothetical protein